MNNTTIYQQLQHHYQKLQTRLAKARNKGKSLSFQERLLSRMQRCALQMKQLGAGVAVVAALGVGTPVLGQNNTVPLKYVELTGVSNPFDTLPQNVSMRFVDIDGDGDQDLFTEKQVYSAGVYISEYKYYENTGSSGSPAFTLQMMNNPLDTLGQFAKAISFVDVDGDGDQDMFASEDAYYSGSSTSSLDYYENTGTQAVADFTLRIGNTNPLQDVETYINGLGLNNAPYLYTSFVDIDNDGDQDCFVSISSAYYGQWPTTNNSDRVLFYQNNGTVNNPNFQRQAPANNPLEIINTTMIDEQLTTEKLLFFDGDRNEDGDIDAMIQSSTGSSDNIYYFNNIGSAGSPNFALSATTPVDSIFIDYPNVPKTALRAGADLDNDGDIELVYYYYNSATNTPELRYFDNVTYNSLVKLAPENSLSVYPNPTTGIIQLDREYTGKLKIYNLKGEVVYSDNLNQTKNLVLDEFDTGLYIMTVQTEEQLFIQKINFIRS